MAKAKAQNMDEVLFDLESSTMQEGEQELKIVDAREVISKKPASLDEYFIAVSLGDEEGNVLEDIVSFAGPANPETGKRGMPKKPYQRRSRQEFCNAISDEAVTSLKKDASNRFPELIGMFVNVIVHDKIDKTTGVAEPKVKKWLKAD